VPPPVSREIDRRTLPHREAGDVAGLVAIRGTAVIFSPSRFLRVTEQIIEHCLKIADPTDMRSEFEAGLLLVSAFFKDDTFIEEQEWRIVSNVKSIDDDMVGFREGKSMLAPYFASRFANTTRAQSRPRRSDLVLTTRYRSLLCR